MLIVERGDIFADRAPVIVIPVNTQGVMGKGLAAAAKDRFHYDLYASYKFFCGQGVKPGETRHWCNPLRSAPCVEFAFTKEIWQDRSRYEWVTQCCLEIAEALRNASGYDADHLADYIAYKPYHREIAIPALGCGEGGLEWSKVKMLMSDIFAFDTDNFIRVYAPVN